MSQAGKQTVYMLREILHDWDDNDSIKILRSVRNAIGSNVSNCKLLIVEACIANSMKATHTPRMTGDVHMMMQYGDAKERDEREFKEVLDVSGFRLTRVIPTKGLFFILEAVPV